MRVSKIALSAMTAMSLVAVPVIAQANPASSLSVAKSVSRTGSPSADVNNARGGKKRGGGFIIAILAAAAIIAGIIIAADNNNNNPTSR